MNTTTPHGPTAVDRAAAAFLLLLMAPGCLALWIAIPAGWLWLAGQITSDPREHVVLSIAGAPVAMILWARVLFWLNRLYLRVIASTAGEDDPEPDDEGEEGRWIRGPLEPLLAVSFVIALATMLFWFFVLAEDPPSMLTSWS